VLKRLIPDTLAGRTIVILLLSLGLFHLWSIWIYQLGIEELLGSTREEQLAEHLVSVGRAVADLPVGERERTARALSTPTTGIHWSPRSLVDAPAAESPRIALIRKRLKDLAPDIAEGRVRLAFADEGEAPGASSSSPAAGSAQADRRRLLASVRLPDESWLNFEISTVRLDAADDHGVLASMSAMALGTLLVSVFLVRSVTAPLRSLSAAADRIGTGALSPDLPAEGPREVRAAASAFNRMQARIKRLLADRTQTLAAVSHDLKTPITRLRLRAQFVPDLEIRRSIEADLDEMEAMIQSTLDFLRGDASGEEVRTVDIATVLETVCDRLVDLGHDVVLLEACYAPLPCRPLALKRAFSNLVENALKYGHRARVSLARHADGYVVVIADDGPGIPEAEFDRVFDPFYRVEGSRSRETGGTGLGLTVARSTILAHGGEIRLANGEKGGLSVTVSLPAPLPAARAGRATPPDAQQG
jgi:signal transduction histidine kinase